MNAGLGNRQKLDNRERLRKCAIGSDKDSCLNKVPLLFVCTSFSQERNKQGLHGRKKGWENGRTLQELLERIQRFRDAGMENQGR